MSLKEQITEDMKAAMRAKDTARLGTIRLLQAAIKQREVDERVTLDDAAVIAVIDKLVKQRKDSIAAYEHGQLTPEAVSALKLHTTEMFGRVADACLQLFGGYGYMTEYPIARLYADARVQRIYGGANEIQRELVGRTL